MSKQPERSGGEQEAIRARAHELSAGQGHTPGRAFDFWLDAEAMLEAQGKIETNPRSLPFAVAFVAGNPTHRWWPVTVTCPIVEDGRTTAVLVNALTADTTADKFELPPTLLSHDSRSVLLQVTAVASALERMAKLVEWAAENAGSVDYSVSFADWDSASGLPVLKQEHLVALLAPEIYPEHVRQIDEALGRMSFRRDVAFDIEEISFGSDLSLLGRFRTSNAAKWLAGAMLFLAAHQAVPPGSTNVTMARPVAAAMAEQGRGMPVIGSVREVILDAIVKEGVDLLKEWAKDTIAGWISSGTKERAGKRQEMERWLREQMASGNARVVQAALAAAHYTPGRIDGIPGYRTIDAATRFCLDHGLQFRSIDDLQMIAPLAEQAARNAIP